jgi:holo-[acyl-carrier-protein] synthase
MLGIDIIEIDRIEESIKKSGEHFLGKVYTPHEINYCSQRQRLGASEFAVRFAAKEAVAKAFGTGMKGIFFHEIEVKNNSLGKPFILLHGRAKALAKKLKIKNIEVSLSHEKKYAVACCQLSK